MVCCEIGTGTSYINRDGSTGFVVPPEDPQALRAAMDRLRADPALAAGMGEAARARLEELFTAQAMAGAYHSLYEELASASL